MAEALSRRLGVSWQQADAFWLALKEVTTPEQYPDLHLFPDIEGAEGSSAGDLVHRFVAAGGVVCKALEPAVRFQAFAGPGLILEGAWLLPEFAHKLSDPATVGVPVKSVFIVEEDREAVFASMLGRGKPSEVTPRHRLLAEMSWRFGLWLPDECCRLGLPVVAARPRETLLERVVAAVELPG